MGACSGKHADCAWNALIENLPAEDFVITADNQIDAQPGDLVEVAIQVSSFHHAVLLAYLLPVAGLVIGAIGGVLFASWVGIPAYSDFCGGRAAVGGLVAALFLIRPTGKRYHPRYTIVRRVTANLSGCPLNCAKATLEQAGFSDFAHFNLAEIGIPKGQSPVSEERIHRIAEHARAVI